MRSLEHHTDWVNDMVLCMDGRNSEWRVRNLVLYIGGNCKTQKLKRNRNEIAECLSVRLMIVRVRQVLVGTEVMLVYVYL